MAASPSMRMGRRSLLVALCACMCGTIGVGPSTSMPAATKVSLVSLIANPQQFNGRRVRVVGVLRLELEGSALYLHREDYSERLTSNAVALEFGPDGPAPDVSRLAGDYVALQGIFDGENRGHLGNYGGVIKVELVASWRDSRR